MNLRSCVSDDYPQIVSIQARADSDANGQPIAPLSVDQLAEQDQQREAHVRFGRWVAERDGRILGWAEHDQTAHRYHPQKFWVDGYVDPAAQRQGIGAALYAQVLAALRPFEPLALRNAVREDQAASIAFLRALGWTEAYRTWLSRLEVAAFDPAPFGQSVARAQAAGIEIKTLPELADDPDRDQKLYDLVWEIRQDLPDVDPATKEPFDTWRARRVHHASIPADAYFVAVHNGTYVGLLYHNTDTETSDILDISQLGVRRAYRGQGIAVALKLRGNAYARAHGYRVLRTGNASSNAPILSINQRMGFVRQPSYLHMVKTFATPTAQA